MVPNLLWRFVLADPTVSKRVLPGPHTSDVACLIRGCLDAQHMATYVSKAINDTAAPASTSVEMRSPLMGTWTTRRHTVLSINAAVTNN